MDLWTDANGWPHAGRYGAAAAAGAAWAFLWVGTFVLDAPLYAFWIAVLLMVSPAVAALGRGLPDLLGLLGTAFGVSLVATTVILAGLGSDPFDPTNLLELLGRSLVAWIPPWAGTLALYGIMRIRGKRREDALV